MKYFTITGKVGEDGVITIVPPEKFAPGDHNMLLVVEEKESPLEKAETADNPKPERIGGQWRGKVKISDDFDELPEYLEKAFTGKPG